MEKLCPKDNKIKTDRECEQSKCPFWSYLFSICEIISKGE